VTGAEHIRIRDYVAMFRITAVRTGDQNFILTQKFSHLKKIREIHKESLYEAIQILMPDSH